MVRDWHKVPNFIKNSLFPLTKDTSITFNEVNSFTLFSAKYHSAAIQLTNISD